MSRAPADLDYTSVLKRSFEVATRPQNLIVLLIGPLILVLASFFSFSLLTGPLGVGFAYACGQMANGRQVELDDILWRGLERLKAAVTAGVPLGLATLPLFFVFVIPGMLALQFGALVFYVIAFDENEPGGFQAIERTWNVVTANWSPILVMGLIASLIGALLSATVVGTVVAVAFFFLVAFFTYVHFFVEAEDPRFTKI